MAVSFPLPLVLFVLLMALAPPSFALFQSSSCPERVLSSEEGTAVYVAVNNLLANIDTSKWYSSGMAFANSQTINGKRIAIRYTRWTQYCTVGTWESAIGSSVLEDFRTTVPYLRPYLLQGCSWAAVSNGYAWIDYYVHPSQITPKGTLILPSSISLEEMQARINVSNTNIASNDYNASTSHRFSASPSRLLLSRLSRYSPVDKTGFVDCPVLPLVLVSHLNGVWDVLNDGEYLTSANKRIQLAMQNDCNLVLTDTNANGRVLWSSNTAGNGKGCFLRLQTEANLVIYNRNGGPVWAINQGCGAGCEKFSSLVIEDDGNLVVYRSQDGRLYKVWATDTKV